MAGSWRVLFSVVVATLVTTSTASAFHGRFGLMRAPASVSYYYVAPYAYWCPPGPMVLPVPDARPKMPYAPATPAPPSATPEPPLQKKAAADARMPMIVTSHSTGGAAAPARPPLAPDRCRVGFWNLSGRDVMLTIDGKTMTLAKDRAVTLDLERQFTWQVAGRPQHVERLADGQATHEVVIQE